MQAEPNQVGALLRAASRGQTEEVLRMLNEGMSVNTSNQSGLQALHFAAKTGNVELAAELLKRGASINVATVKGNTPLHVATLSGQTEVVKLLLKHDAQVNVKSTYQQDTFTPLYMAAQIGHQEIVTLLLAHGADISTDTTNGSTAKDVAMQQGHEAVAKLLEEYELRIKGIHKEDTLGLSTIHAKQRVAGEGPSGPPPRYEDVIAASPKHVPVTKQ